MKNNNKFFSYLLALMLILILAGCYKDATLNLNANAVVNQQVSFSKDLVPIFTQKCALTGCHASGGQNPDLSAAKAYNSLVSGGFINVTTPGKSIIYMRLTGQLTPAMPLTGASNPLNLNALVLTWITQKAQNN